jgi:hypothetical protein
LKLEPNETSSRSCNFCMMLISVGLICILPQVSQIMQKLHLYPP